MSTKLYVSTKTGKDTNTGLSGSPFATITKALAVAQPFTDIMINAGVYKEKLKVTKPNVRLIGMGALKTFISDSDGVGVRFESTAEYSTISRVTVSGHAYGGLKPAAKGVRISTCIIMNNGWGIVGDAFGGSGITTSNAFGIQLLYNVCGFNREHGIYVSAGADGTVVSGNVLKNNGDKARALGGNGLQVNADGAGYPSKGLKITNNTITYSVAKGMALMGVVDSVIDNNGAYDNGKGGIALTKGSKNNKITYNTVVSSTRACIELGGSGNYEPGINNEVAFNTLTVEGDAFAAFPITFVNEAMPFSIHDNVYVTSKPHVAFNDTTKQKLTEEQFLALDGVS